MTVWVIALSCKDSSETKKLEFFLITGKFSHKHNILQATRLFLWYILDVDTLKKQPNSLPKTVYI